MGSVLGHQKRKHFPQIINYQNSCKEIHQNILCEEQVKCILFPSNSMVSPISTQVLSSISKFYETLRLTIKSIGGEEGYFIGGDIQNIVSNGKKLWVCGTFTRIGRFQNVSSGLYGPQIVELSITDTTNLFQKTFTIIPNFPSPGADCSKMFPLEDGIVVRENSVSGALRILKEGSVWDRITNEITDIRYIDARSDHSTIYVLAKDLTKTPTIGDRYFLQKYNAKSGTQWKTVIPPSDETDAMGAFTHGAGGDKEIYVTFISGTGSDPDRDEKVFLYKGDGFVRLGKGKFSRDLSVSQFLNSQQFKLHYDSNSDRLIVYGDDVNWYTIGDMKDLPDRPFTFTSKRLNKIAFYDNVNDTFIPAFGGGFSSAPLRIYNGDDGATYFSHNENVIAYDTWSPCKYWFFSLI